MMNNSLIFLIFGLLFCIMNCRSVARCPNGEILSPQGCIVDCKAPQWDRCQGMVFPRIYYPRYCVWTVNNEWKSSTYDCQGCDFQGAIGIKDGRCTGSESTNNPFTWTTNNNQPFHPMARPCPYPSSPANKPFYWPFRSQKAYRN